jgi:hypothetical protein
MADTLVTKKNITPPLLALLLCLAGCNTFDIEGYPPLTKLVERPSLSIFGVHDRTLTTKGSHVYVGDLGNFLETYPPGSVEWVGKMKHEQVHGRSQFAYLGLPGEMALTAWLARYIVDVGFMWSEERAGYYVQIKHLQSYGLWPPQRTLSLAESLSNGIYKTVLGKPMASYEDALNWINAVLAGTWTPPE